MIFIVARKTQSLKVHSMLDIVGAIANPQQALTLADDLSNKNPEAHAFVGIAIAEGAKYEVFQVRDLSELIEQENQKFMKNVVDNSGGGEP
jgi:hypothetical protein